MDKDCGLKWILLLVVLTGPFLFASSIYAGWSNIRPPAISTNWELLNLSYPWAVGQDLSNKEGILLHFSSGSWTSVALPSISSNWGLSDVASSSNEVWAVGQDLTNQTGALLRFSDGSWTSVEPPGISTNWGLSALKFTFSSGGWMVGQDFQNKRGVILFFATEPVTPPTLTTTVVSGITTTTATSGGTITSDGGASVTVSGICWDTSSNPAVGGNCTTDGTTTGTFTSSMSGLTPSTGYHVRAYATNSAGTGYGNDVTFTTLSALALPTVITSAVSSLTSTTATSGGTVTSDGGVSVTDRGVCWGTSLNPDVTLPSCTHNGTGTGTFTSFITGLSPNTAYHIRGFATNSSGTGYGNDLIFTTLIASTAGLSIQLIPKQAEGADVTAAVSRPIVVVQTLPDVSSDWGLSGVSQVWAVGRDNEKKGGVLLHFVGDSWISVILNDVVSSSDWELTGVDVISSKEAWAVGQDFENKRGILLHFINGSWTSVEPPAVSADWGLSNIELISSNEAWAAGQDFTNQRGVLLHFVNGSWTPVDLPDVSSDWGLSAVDVISSNQGWAVGRASDGQSVDGVLLQYTVPLISVSPAAIDYHEVEVGASSDQTVVVRNTGNGGLAISEITSPSFPFVILTDTCSGVTLAPLQTCGVTYRFLPDSEGIFDDSSTITSNGGVATVTLTGTGSSETLNYILLANPADGQTFTVCPDLGSSLFEWESSGVFTGITLQFSATADFSEKAIGVRGNPGTNQVTLPTSTWKKVLLLPGADGGTIYWTVIGKKKDKTKVEGDLFSFEVAGAEPVANPEMSGTSKRDLPPPILSWENRCNTKFKAWFGNSADLQKSGRKKVAISFSIKDPNENQGIFTVGVTSSQWSSIRRLGGDVTGAVLYWYVESWDPLGRQKKTDIMSFTLTD